jgi:transcriptional regulator NrdR family protein
MTIAKFESIKNSIVSATKKRDMAEGAKQKIVEEWKKSFDISTQEEVESKLIELESEIESDKEKRDKLMTKLDAVTDWSQL